MLNFSENLKKYRKEVGLSQEELASRMGITAQAVSKWECGLSYPDVTLLLPLSELFGITADEMLRGIGSATLCEGETVTNDGPEEKESITDHNLENDDILKDDGVLRVVQCLGRRILRADELDSRIYIPLSTLDNRIYIPLSTEECIAEAFKDGRTPEFHIFGNANIKGDVKGNVNSSKTVNCGDVEGNACANGSLNCGTVEGNAHASGTLNCDTIEGNASAGGNLIAEVIEGDAKAGGKVIYIRG